MKIDIKHIAKLSKLYFDEDSEKKFQSQMQNIVGMVENLPEIEDTITVSVSNAMELRPDTVEKSFSRSVLLANAPETAAGCVVVPKTIEG